MVCGRKKKKKIFWPKEEEVLDWRKLHSDRLHDLYHSLIIIPLIKSWRMRWGECNMYGAEQKYIKCFGGGS
jgi:hypothetical protein